MTYTSCVVYAICGTSLETMSNTFFLDIYIYPYHILDENHACGSLNSL